MNFIYAWYALKLIGAAILIIGIIIIFMIIIIQSIIKDADYKKKIKYLEQYGFERYLHNVSSVGGKSFYGWKKTGDKYGGTIRILESELSYMTLEQLQNILR